MQKWLFALLVGLMALPGAFSARTLAQSDSPVRVVLAMDAPGNLDPASLSRFDTPTRDLVENLFIGLTRFNARTGQVDPWLAQSWTVSPDGLTWTFQLREDVQWVRVDPTTGTAETLRPVVAADVVFAVHRACDPERPSPVTDNLYVVAGCRTVTNPNTLETFDLDQTVGIRALDETTLEIQLMFPNAGFLTMTTLPEFRPLPAELINDSIQPALRPDTLVTSGPWVVESWMVGQSMRLIRNPFWPDDYAGNVEVIEVTFSLAAEAVVAQFGAGAVDVMRLQAGHPALAQLPSERLRHADGPTLTLLGFSFNNQNVEGAPVPSPLDLPEVRRALALAIDREALAAQVLGQAAEAADHFTPLTVIAAPSAPGATFDARAAQRSLAQAGYASCASLGQLTLAVGPEPLELQIAQFIVGQWQTHLACPAEVFPVVQVPRRALIDSAHNTVDVAEASRYPLWLLYWSADYPDAQAWIADALHCGYGYFRVGRGCGPADQLLDQAGRAADLRTRFTTYNQVETEFFGVLGSFPVIPLAMDQRWWVQAERLQGVANYGPFQFDRWSNAETP
ncbi:MAG: hypothetical protein HC915_14995 [Anaerolineae bacterium]|nr:hypothetical protein [Anaerolineae bacterium]